MWHLISLFADGWFNEPSLGPRPVLPRKKLKLLKDSEHSLLFDSSVPERSRHKSVVLKGFFKRLSLVHSIPFLSRLPQPSTDIQSFMYIDPSFLPWCLLFIYLCLPTKRINQQPKVIMRQPTNHQESTLTITSCPQLGHSHLTPAPTLAHIHIPDLWYLQDGHPPFTVGLVFSVGSVGVI